VRTSQSGQTLIMFAITMTFLFLALIALVGDADVLMVRYNQVNSLALLAAQTGATAVDEQDFYNGNYHLKTTEPDSAIDRCESVSPNVRCHLDAAAQPTRVTATASMQVSLPIPLFGTTATVSSTRTGQAVFGGAQALP